MIGIQVLGVDATVAKFVALIGAAQVAKAAAERAEAALVLEGAKSRAPVDTGRLKSAIVVTQDDGDTVVGPQGVDYARFVERGTADAPAQPFMRPAADAGVERFPAEMAAALAIAFRVAGVGL